MAGADGVPIDRIARRDFYTSMIGGYALAKVNNRTDPFVAEDEWLQIDVLFFP